MAGKITRDILESYLNCRYKAHLKTAGERGAIHDYESLMKESRLRTSQAAKTKLIERIGERGVLSGLPLGLDVLKQGLPLLLDTVFEDEDLSIRFDALRRVEGESLVGDFHYQPVLFHEVEKPTVNVRTLLAILGVILGAAQGREPVTGMLFFGADCREMKIKLDGATREANRLLREIREARIGPRPRLMLNSHCHNCEFRERCHAEAISKDDLSLLRGISKTEIEKYAKRGVFTCTQLSFTFRPPKKTKGPGSNKVLHALHAMAIREKKIHVLGSPSLPASAKRIYLDLEGDPERRFTYLAGMVISNGASEVRRSFWIDSPADESVLLDHLLSVMSRNPDAWLFSYGDYEAAFIRRVGKTTGRNDEIASVLDRLCNVLSIIYSHVYFPVHSNGLKSVAGNLGFCWTEPDASGIQSLVWRRRWEESGDLALKIKLVTYNLEDCDALKKVTEFLYAACLRPSNGQQQLPIVGHEVARVDETGPTTIRREWCRADFVVGDFEFINERAYFDYQRDKVYVRTSKALKRSKSRNQGRKGKHNLPGNQHVDLQAASCPYCGSTDLSREPDGRLVRLAFDLRITRGCIRRFVTRFKTTHHVCAVCRKRFLPWEYLRLDPHSHSLKSWAMYQHIVHRTSLANVAQMLKEYFGLPVIDADVNAFKMLLARHYEETYKRLLQKLLTGKHIHADETEIHLKGNIKGYVWVFTNLEEALYIYKPSREGSFVHGLLKGFRGVLVSDFYAAYDSLDCPQQKCLIHLIRDFNHDMQGNPWDEELKSIASIFGKLLRSVVATVDEHGLKRGPLTRHKPDVDRFFEFITKADYRSEMAEGYRKRLLKSQGKLFTFMEHDGVPWNNNNAEHAIKRFAYYRELTDGMLTETGLNQYLVLLSICQTCRYKGISFLRFLLSREADIDQFCMRPRKTPRGIELLPEYYSGFNRGRKQNWDE